MFFKKRLEELERRINKIENELFVVNHFKDCPCCDGGAIILKSEAISFKKIVSYSYGLLMPACPLAIVCYTTKESYKTHKDKIKKWEREVKEYLSK